MDKYYIYCRYEMFTKFGKQFCKWYMNSCIGYSTIEEAKNKISQLKQDCLHTEKITKLKYQFDIQKIDEMLIPQVSLRRPKGSPKKIHEEYLDTVIDKLKESGICKIDDNIKSFIYNDKKYLDYISSKLNNETQVPILWYDESNNKTLYIVLKDKKIIEDFDNLYKE